MQVRKKDTKQVINKCDALALMVGALVYDPLFISPLNKKPLQ